jgi:peroxiredoxin family protein
MKPSLVVFLHSHRYDRLYQAMSLLLTASSMGWPCHLFLFYGALASYIGQTWDDINIVSAEQPAWADALQRGFEEGNFPSLYEMLGKAREQGGGVRVYACSASCKTLDLDLAAVRGKVDEVVGLPTMLKISEYAKHVMYI